MKDRLLKQAGREYNPRQRYATLFFLAPLFLFLLPFGLIKLGAALDRWLNLPKILFGSGNLILGVFLIAAGWSFAIWSIYVQFTLGRGTPIPLMATQKLIILPPYSYCRNPMALGAIVMYLGVAVWIGSIGALLLVVIGSAALLIYIKLLEEKEMELRFGADYQTYKAKTPFIIPRLQKKDHLRFDPGE